MGAFVAQAVSSSDMQIGSGRRRSGPGGGTRALDRVDPDLVDEDGDAGGHRAVEVGAVVHLEERMQAAGLALPGLLEQPSYGLGNRADRLVRGHYSPSRSWLLAGLGQASPNHADRRPS